MAQNAKAACTVNKSLYKVLFFIVAGGAVWLGSITGTVSVGIGVSVGVGVGVGVSVGVGVGTSVGVGVGVSVGVGVGVSVGVGF